MGSGFDRVWGFGFRVQGLRAGVEGFGIRFKWQDLGFRAEGLLVVFRVQVFGLSVQGSGLRVN